MPRVRSRRRRRLRLMSRVAAAHPAAALRPLRQADRVAGAPLLGVLGPAGSRSRRRARRSPTTTAFARSSRAGRSTGSGGSRRPRQSVVVASLDRPEADALTFVPPDRNRLLQRGHHPAERLARELGRRWQLPVLALLSRTGPAHAPGGSDARRTPPERSRRVLGQDGARDDLPDRRRLHVRRDGVRGGVRAPKERRPHRDRRHVRQSAAPPLGSMEAQRGRGTCDCR